MTIEHMFAEAGGEYVADTSAHPGNFFAIQALETATFSAITSSNLTNIPAVLVIPAGVVIYGAVSTFTLASGKVIAYRRL